MLPLSGEQLILAVAALGLLVLAAVVEKFVRPRWPGYAVTAVVCAFSLWIGISKNEVLGGPLVALWAAGVLVVCGGCFARTRASDRAEH